MERVKKRHLDKDEFTVNLLTPGTPAPPRTLVGGSRLNEEKTCLK